MGSMNEDRDDSDLGMTEAEFDALWAQGEPISLTNAGSQNRLVIDAGGLRLSATLLRVESNIAVGQGVPVGNASRL